jgi:hypothetical protein
MAEAALFIGWGAVVPGRERQAQQVFDEGVAYWSRLQQEGEIESFEPVALEPHGGDLGGFCLLRGERERLSRLRHSEEFRRLNARASLVVRNFGVVSADLGEQLRGTFATFQEQTGDLV